MSIARALYIKLISQVKGCLYLSKAFPVESNCNVVICEEAVYNREGISGDHIFSVNIFGRGAYVSEGFSGVIGNEQEDCNHIEDTGVESVKGMSKFDSLSDP